MAGGFNKMKDSYNSLFETASFRFIFSLVIFFDIALILYITTTSDLYFQKGWQGLNNLFEIFKFPIYATSAGMALLALVSYNHRSHQTYTQISEQMTQNKLSNHFKNKEEFVRYAEAHKIDLTIQTTSPPTFPFEAFNYHSVYSFIFPNSPDGDFSISNEILSYEAHLHSITEGLCKIAKGADPGSYRESSYQDFIERFYNENPFGDSIKFKYSFSANRWIDSELIHAFIVQLKSMIYFLKVVDSYSRLNNFPQVHREKDLLKLKKLAEQFSKEIEIKTGFWYDNISNLVRAFRNIDERKLNHKPIFSGKEELINEWTSELKKYSEKPPETKKIVKLVLSDIPNILDQSYFDEN